MAKHEAFKQAEIQLSLYLIVQTVTRWAGCSVRSARVTRYSVLGRLENVCFVHSPPPHGLRMIYGSYREVSLNEEIMTNLAHDCTRAPGNWNRSFRPGFKVPGRILRFNPFQPRKALKLHIETWLVFEQPAVVIAGPREPFINISKRSAS